MLWKRNVNVAMKSFIRFEAHGYYQTNWTEVGVKDDEKRERELEGDEEGG
jgi:hypothetical protein